MNKKIFIIFLFILVLFNVNTVQAQSIEKQKKEIIALYSSNNLEEAYNMISKIPEKDRDYELWYLLANLSQDLNNEDNAVFFLQKSISKKPEFDKAHYNLGNIYLKQKMHNRGIEEYKVRIK